METFRAIGRICVDFRNRIDRVFLAPRGRDEDGRRQEYILNIILFASIVMLVVLDALVLYHSFERQPRYTGIPFPLFSAFPLTFILLYLLSRRGHPALSAHLLIAILLLSNTYSALNWGIDLPVTLLVYAFIVCTAAILLGNRTGFLVTLFTALFIAGIWSIHIHGIIVPKRQYPSEDDIIILGVFYFLIMTVSWLSNREIEKSFKRARASEHELKKERDLLEVRVSERTEELRRAQFEEVAQIHRFAEFGRLASGLFHDLLSVLNAVSLRTEGYADDESSLAAATDTTREIRKFMRAVQEQINKDDREESFFLAENIEQAVQLVTYRANKENVRISFDRPRGQSFAYEGAPFKMQQIMINLLTNAIDAYRSLPSGISRTRIVHISLGRAGKNFMITVKDNGEGIPSAIFAKIFDPFFTTKSDTGGSGIGLAAVKKIVEEDLHGSITATTRQGEGTTFSVIFPIQCAIPTTSSSMPSSIPSSS